MILVSLAHRILLYVIPELTLIRHGIPSPEVAVTPLAMYGGPPIVEKNLLWNSFCSHLGGTRLTTVVQSEHGGFDVIIFPRPGEPEDTLVRHEMGMGDFGASRAIWSHVTNGGIELRSCTHFMRPDTHVGYMRLGRSKAPDPSRVVRIPGVGHAEELLDVSFDEPSGVIFLLVSCSDNGEVNKKVIMVNLV